MNILTFFRRQFRSLGQRRAVKQEIDEELRYHLEQRTAENIAAGMSPEDAAREARKRFGNWQSVREECREARGASFGEATWMDLKFAFRQLRKNPGFTAVAVLTLALGIGANTAIFSVVNAVLLKALPYQQPDRLVMLWTDNPALDLGFSELPPAPVDLTEWRQQARSFEQIAAFRPWPANLAEDGDPERIGGIQVTADFFPLLGVAPMWGRSFNAEEEQPGTDRVAVISYGLWQRRFGGQPNVIGRFITVNQERREIVGIMPPGFNFPHGSEMPPAYGLMKVTDIWLPFAENAAYWRRDDTREFIAMGRIKDGVSLDQAQTEMDVIAGRQGMESPADHEGWIVHLRPLANQVAGTLRPLLFVLLGAVGFVLLIACANLANLLLCRANARQKEIAVRAALGAGRRRILRQLLTESLLLSTLGGLFGLVLGTTGIRAILVLAPPNIARLNETTLDGRVLLFTVVVSLVSGIIFGLAPAWRASWLDFARTLNASGRSGSARGWQRTHGLLVAGEVALAVVLLTGAGLMAQSFLRLQAVDLGFQPQHLTAFDVGLYGEKYGSGERQRQFYREAVERLGKLPGIRSAAAISSLPLGGPEQIDLLYAEGQPLPSAENTPNAETRRTTPGYFETMGMALLQGRDFTSRDTANQPLVCIINETIARNFFAGTDAVGHRLKLGETDDHAPWLTVVGVVRDVRSSRPEAKPRPQVYRPLEQDPQNMMTVVVRAGVMSDATLERAIRGEMKSLDPFLPVANYRTMERLVSDAVARPRFTSLLLGLFAVTALALTAVGLYGVVGYAAAQRTREIGIRMALGANARNVLGLILRQGMVPAVVGLVVGLVGSLALTRLLASQLYEVKPTDPATFLGVALFLLSVAMFACWLPARRAAKVDPMVALRHE